MTDPNKQPPPEHTDFPSLDWEDEALETRPMGLHEQPLQARLDREMQVITAQHPHVAAVIEKLWGYPQCQEYIRSLVFDGFKQGQQRTGFKPDVLAALMHLSSMHEADNRP